MWNVNLLFYYIFIIYLNYVEKYNILRGRVMSKLNNILKMIFILSKGTKVKGKEIASQLEVNEKQVRRYKEILDEFFDIRSIPGPNGGYVMEKS